MKLLINCSFRYQFNHGNTCSKNSFAVIITLDTEANLTTDLRDSINNSLRSIGFSKAEVTEFTVQII